jgi:tetratricopeptide (TPR) repeat protein
MRKADGEADLSEALERARRSPEDDAAWDAVEELAGSTQRFEEVAALYEDVLSRELGPRLARTLGERAVRFIEEWYGEDAPELVRVLERVLEHDPGATWAFSRLTVVHTAAGRFEDLFGLYDKALASEEDLGRRKTLLEEAANVAKDFAADASRAIGYLRELVPLAPKDPQLAASLERLLEREERYEDLIELWAERLAKTRKKDKAQALRFRIAETYFDKLGRPKEALSEIRRLVESGDSTEGTLSLLERLSDSESTAANVRKDALVVLKELYAKDDRPADVVRTLERAIELSSPDARATLHREAGQLLYARGELEPAMKHFASLLKVDPTARDALVRLREIAKRTTAYHELASALERAADSAEDTSARVALRTEAGDIHRVSLDDAPGAIALYQRVLQETDAEPPAVLEVARRLADLLGHAGRAEERLLVLERLSATEPSSADRRAALGQAARVADSLGDPDRALLAWRTSLESEPNDLEALDATIGILEREARWDELLEALERRASAPVPPFRKRSDLVHRARVLEEELDRVDDAIASWRRIADSFGEDPETVDALASLQGKAERWEDMNEVLERAAIREGQHVATIYARIGEVSRKHLANPKRATRAYADALRIEPTATIARDGLNELLADPECLREAVEALASAYRDRDEWQSVTKLLEHRLQGARNPHERVAVLRETAHLHEDRGNDLKEALLCVRRAMAIAPDMRDIEGEVFRLAEATGRWEVAVAAIRDAVDALGPDTPRARYLRYWEGKLCENELDRPGEALDAYGAVLVHEPGRLDAAQGLVRTAAKLGRPDKMTEALFSVARSTGKVPEELLTTIETETDRVSAWDALTDEVETQLAASTGLTPTVGREIAIKLGHWHRTRRDDGARAEAALARAAAIDDQHVPTLEAVAAVQRRAPGLELYTTLMRLADLVEANLDPLREAAEVALTHLGDVDVQKKTTDRLYREAARLWRRQTETTGRYRPDECARWALDRLVELYDRQGEPGMMVAVLADAAHLPIDGDESRALRRRAADIASEVGDRSRAIVLYRGILDEAPDDQATLRALSAVCEAEGRLPEMMALLQHELTLADDRDRRLQIRLDLARVVGEMERRGGRVESLLSNLKERPGHEPSIEALTDVLEKAHRFQELADTLTEQAEKLEGQGEAKAAARLLGKAAELAETRLADVDRALLAHRRVVELAPESAASLDALARLHTDRKEHGRAASWLERRLAITEGALRADVARKLAEAHLGAGQSKKAAAVLAQALDAAPERSDLREMLAIEYRKENASEPLARLLTDAASHLDDRDRLLAYAREAAALYTALGSPNRAIPILERAASEAPDDRDIRTLLAIAYRVDGRLDEAHALLTEVVESYGRRRNAERATVHHHLALVYQAQGKFADALNELEAATKMDVRNPTILATLGSLAHEAGDLDRAERALRALLLIVRRHEGPERLAVGASEVLYELHRLARARNDESQAGELLASATEAAAQTDEETEALVRTLRRRGASDLALNVLDKRMEEVGGRARAKLSLDAAEIEANDLQNPRGALDRAISAAGDAPDDDAILDRATELARTANGVRAWADALEAMVKSAASNKVLASDLLLRLGSLYENELADPGEARVRYERVELLGKATGTAWRGLARVARSTGDAVEELRVLSLLLEAADSAAGAEERTDAMFRVAEIRLRTGRDGGLELLTEALDRDLRYGDAGAILRETTAGKHDEAAMRLYERVARASANKELLLDYLEKRSGSSDVSLGELREAADIALERSDAALAERFLTQAVELAAESAEDVGNAISIATDLARIHKDRGDFREAVGWMERAAALTTDDERAFELRLEAAELSAQDDAGLEVAAETYRTLLEHNTMDARVYSPLLDVYLRLGDEDRLNDLANHVIDGLLDPLDRNRVRLMKARLLVTREGREPDAAEVLRAILDEDSNDAEANRLLIDLFERTGYDEDLAELLSRQLDVARDNEDKDAIRDLTLRLGGLHEKVRREDAIDVYRRGIDWLPEDRELSLALLSQLGDDEEHAHERLELDERLLASESGDAAAERALRIAAAWANAGEDDNVRRVLERGYSAASENDSLRDQLETFYRQRELYDPLSSYLVAEARRRDGARSGIDLFREAAFLLRDNLGREREAAELLAEARAHAPVDVGLLTDLAKTRTAAGDFAIAVQEIEDALEAADNDARARLLRLRAELATETGALGDALADLEAAYELLGAEVAYDLVSALERARANDPLDRPVVLRLVAVRAENGDAEGARVVLSDWLVREPEDREALYLLRDMDRQAEAHDALADTLSRIVPLETGEAQLTAVLDLADAYERAGTPERGRDALEAVNAASERSASVEIGSAAQPETRKRVRDRLRQLYEAIGAHFELGGLLLMDAEASQNDDERYELLRRAGDHYLRAGDPDSATGPLHAAVQIRPDDHAATILLVDSYIAAERYAEAGQLLEVAIANHTRRRSPELGELQHRMAGLARAAGDRELELQWLNAALDSDKTNGMVASELAQLAMELGEHDVALGALRVVTLNKTEGPMSRAMAFLLQARIAHERGEARRAILWARKAKSEDPGLLEADQFLQQLGEA